MNFTVCNTPLEVPTDRAHNLTVRQMTLMTGRSRRTNILSSVISTNFFSLKSLFAYTHSQLHYNAYVNLILRAAICGTCRIDFLSPLFMNDARLFIL